MKILHINSYSLGRDLYRHLYREQLNAGVSLIVYVPTLMGGSIKDDQESSHIIVSPTYRKHHRFLFFLKQKRIYLDLKNKVNLKDISVVHAHSLFTNGHSAMRLKVEYGIPYIVAVRNTDLNYFFKYMFHLRKTGVDIMRHADQVIFLSEPYLRKTIESYVPSNEQSMMIKKSAVIPNGIDSFWHDNKYKQKDLQPGRLRLLEVGEINKNKNQLKVMEVSEVLKERGFNVELTFIGESKDSNILRRIEHHDHASYKRPMSKEELLSEYRTNDIFVMPSRQETFGLVYSEALSQGTPIIYTRGQGFDGQFEDGSVGFAVDPENTEEIADRIVDVLNNYSDMSARAVGASEKFDWVAVSEKYLLLYQESLK